MNCSNASHEIFSLQQLKVIKYVWVHLEGHMMLSKLVHEGKSNSNSWAHGTGKAGSHVNSMLSKCLKTCSILCCFIFCKERASQAALVRAPHGSGHGPCSQAALLPASTPGLMGTVNKSVWALWWAPREVQHSGIINRREMPEFAQPPSAQKPRQSCSRCIWSSGGAVNLKPGGNLPLHLELRGCN